VPDGVLYLVEGAGGNRDFDGDLGPARGSGLGIDQDDSATGTAVVSGLVFPNGPRSWLDTHLTNTEMGPVVPNAGSGPKITVKFKAKLFSFADIVVRDNELTLYQISEPLQGSSSASAAEPLPFGTDVNGERVNDPIPDTLVDPSTGHVVSPPADGPSVLLDRFTVKKPHLEDLQAGLEAPPSVAPGGQITYTLHVRNGSQHHLNGTQAVFHLPAGVRLVSSPDGSATRLGKVVVVTLGRLGAGSATDVHLTVELAADSEETLSAFALVRSSTALPSEETSVQTRVSSGGGLEND